MPCHKTLSAAFYDEYKLLQPSTAYPKNYTQVPTKSLYRMIISASDKRLQKNHFQPTKIN